MQCRIKYGALHILINVANQCWDVQDLIFVNSAMRFVIPLCKTSNTPALVAAGVALLCSMSYRERSRSRLIKAGAVRVLDPIAKTQRVDLNSVSADVARTNLRRHAACIMVALVKGHIDRKRLKREAQARKMRRLGSFFRNMVFHKCFIIWAQFAKSEIEHREKLQTAMKRMLNRTALLAFHRLLRYIARRHVKYDKMDTAIAFANRSLVARNRKFRNWKEYMYQHGSWWTPDAAMESMVKERCSSFVAHMTGHWFKVCFQAWHELLVKKKRAMRRWQNSALFFTFTSWTEYMYTEGPWWEPDDDLKRELDQKCGKFLAAMSGNYMQSTFSDWKTVVQRKKRAAQRWLNRCLTNMFDQWHDDVFVDTYELYMKVEDKCGHVRALISGQFQQICFRWWREHLAKIIKSKKFLTSIKNTPLRNAWQGWMDFMYQGSWWQPDDDLQAQLESKCGHLIAMMTGDATRVIIQQWHSVAHKNRRAMLRWKNQTLHHGWKGWFEFHMRETTRKRRSAIIRAKRRILELIDNWEEWICCTDERRFRRSLVGDAILMWVHRPEIWAFRTLDEHCQRERHHRFVVSRFRSRFELRPARNCLLMWVEQAEKQSHLRLLMYRIRNNSLVWSLTRWHDTVRQVSRLCTCIERHKPLP